MDLYTDHILDHYRHPRNQGEIPDAKYHAREYNPTCGDDIEVFFNVDDEQRVADIRFMNQGCAISTAAASMLTEFAKTGNMGEIAALTDDDFLARLELDPTPGRRACALLAFHAFQKAARG